MPAIVTTSLLNKGHLPLPSHRGGQMSHSPDAMEGYICTAAEEELAEVVREAVTKRLHHKAIITITTSEEETDSDFLSTELTRRKKPLQSGKIRTVNYMVVKPHMTCPYHWLLAIISQLSRLKPVLQLVMAKHLRTSCLTWRFTPGQPSSHLMLYGCSRYKMAALTWAAC